jgi:hypothetical protein
MDMLYSVSPLTPDILSDSISSPAFPTALTFYLTASFTPFCNFFRSLIRFSLFLQSKIHDFPHVENKIGGFLGRYMIEECR